MDEFDLIRRHFAPLAVLPGADGLRDDVAEISPGLIATVDTLVEGVHFLSDDPISTVGQKLVRVNVSDVVAKGGRPSVALLALTWPADRPEAAMGDLARAIGKDLARWGASLVGGDTSSTAGPLTLSLTLLGQTGPRGPVRRRGARPGDDLWVTGPIGDSWLGLQAATGALGALSAEAKNLLVSRYRIPEPPALAMADLIGEVATSAIDVSDGLVADAAHVAEASGLALVIEAEAVPFSPVVSHYLANARIRLEDVLTGGDDYQTLFSAPPAARDIIARAVRPPVLIGHAEAGAGVRVLAKDGAAIPIARGGWRHFGGEGEA